MDYVRCPQCGRPAEVVDRNTLGSTAGPFELLKIRCLYGHWFTPPAEDVEAIELKTPVESAASQ